MIIDNEFDINQEVFLKTDVEQSLRLVTAITIRQEAVVYELSCGVMSSWHSPFEISEHRIY